MPRLAGSGKHAINYRHVIDSLVRKPGAFENYQYHQDLFPTSHFRMAYDDLLRRHSPRVAARQYLKILQLAARDSQDAVNDALRMAVADGVPISLELIRRAVDDHQQPPPPTELHIESPDLSQFDSLLQHHHDMEVHPDDYDNSHARQDRFHHAEPGHSLPKTPPKSTAELIEQFRELRLPMFREHFEVQATRATQESLSHMEYLSELAELECQARRESRIARLMNQSRLPTSKTWDNFDWKRLPLQVTRQMESLREGSFLDRRENLLLFGKPGSGKSHCLCALAEQLVQTRSLGVVYDVQFVGATVVAR